ncbi:hypothetical protein MG293_014257 [Ovis ammon polii]|uniref:Lipocalin/cytosolic fatty-acid binding domain-containing protein n=1 Tax=Ovis ammon polii TaxID=230172 RepID=A0AAD4Y354_OVIAM|nr:hypothetical protein MG293_014257 [Ovis ammon polii]
MQEKNVELLDLNNNQSHHKLYYTAKCQAPECSSLSHKKTARKRRLVHLELTANQLSVAQIYADSTYVEPLQESLRELGVFGDLKVVNSFHAHCLYGRYIIEDTQTMITEKTEKSNVQIHKKGSESCRMKVLVLSLLLGLVCDAQEADDQKTLSQTGEPPKLHWHQLIKGKRDTAERKGLNGEWVAKHVTGQKTENNTYVVEYEGENKFEVIYASDTVLVVSVVNKDKNKKCGEIQLAGIFVKVNDIEEKALEIFKELLKLKGIEEKYIVNFFKGGLNCQLQNAISNSSKRATGWEYNQNLMKKEKPKSEANDFPAERSCPVSSCLITLGMWLLSRDAEESPEGREETPRPGCRQWFREEGSSEEKEY